ncbi:MAG TPA: arginine N-succinyltransferase [Allosphingosinicella sp.]
MWLIRPVRIADLEAVTALAEALGPGMTTLPADRTAIAGKIEHSVATFAGAAQSADAQYLLVLEDQGSGNVLGTAAIYPSIGSPYGFFSYRITRLVQHSQELGLHLSTTVLHLANDYTGATEVGTLAVHPRLRRSGAGRLLAKSRYVLMATFPHLFSNQVIAEMRGIQTEDGESPFWNALGRRFFQMDFARADKLSAVEGAAFIADLLPKQPVYLDLLPAEARAVVGKPHNASAPAMAMLLAEGFRFEGLVDIFDAGPQLVAERTAIRTVTRCREVALAPSEALACQPPNALIASTQLEAFGIAVAAGRCRDTAGDVEPAVLRALDLAQGDGAVLLELDEAEKPLA